MRAVFMLVWGEMGNAFIQLLESKVWLALICKHMECYPFMHHVECLEITQCAEFEDCEKTIMELKLLPLKTLYDWMVANGCFSFLILLEFPLISLLLLDLLVHLLYTSCIPELDPFALLMNLIYLTQKRRKRLVYWNTTIISFLGV